MALFRSAGEALALYYFMARNIVILALISTISTCVGQQFIIASMPNAVETAQHKSMMSQMFGGMSPDRVRAGRVPWCDDGKQNLTADWNGWSGDYTCQEERWKPASNPRTELSCEPTFPRQAIHFCIGDKIPYDVNDIVPTSGDHRPSWAVYGEYRHLPKQRWLHNMEHGAVVFLYHPCADQGEIDKLKAVVKGCLRRHVITAYNKLPKSTPFALTAWGCKLMLSSADENAARQFIMICGFKGSAEQRAKHGAEQLSDEGQYDWELIERAAVVSDIDDTVLCPGTQLQGSTADKFFMR